MSESLQCPHCPGKPLFDGKRGTVSLHGCGSCGGLWVGNELAGRLLAQLEPDAMALAHLAAQNAQPFPPMAPAPACPVCRAVLRRITVAGTAVPIDLCDQHGTWFDREELQTVAHFFEERRRAALTAAKDFPPPMRFDPADYPQTDGSRGWVSHDNPDDDGLFDVMGLFLDAVTDSKKSD